MIERSMERFDLYPAKLMGDTAEMICWLVCEHGIESHVTVFDKSERQDSVRWAAHESGGLQSLRRSDEGAVSKGRGNASSASISAFAAEASNGP